MEDLKIVLDGRDAFPELAGRTVRTAKIGTVFALPGGMASGRTSVGVLIELDDGTVVFAETSLRLFHGAAMAFLGRYGLEEEPPKPAAPVKDAPPVDREAITTTHGTPIGEHLDLKPNGQQRDYVVLTAAERAKGFVRPVRASYVHLACGGETIMSPAIAETYARDPSFYSSTFCVNCSKHFPVGPDGEFVWTGTDEKVGT